MTLFSRLSRWSICALVLALAAAIPCQATDGVVTHRARCAAILPPNTNRFSSFKLVKTWS